MKRITKKLRLAFLREQLKTNPAWARGGLLRIYERQTVEEQAAETTIESNGKGFSALDAEFLSSLAEQVKSGSVLSRRQQDALQRIMPRYAAQLLSISDVSKLDATINKQLELRINNA